LCTLTHTQSYLLSVLRGAHVTDDPTSVKSMTTSKMGGHRCPQVCAECERIPGAAWGGRLACSCLPRTAYGSWRSCSAAAPDDASHSTSENNPKPCRGVVPNNQTPHSCSHQLCSFTDFRDYKAAFFFLNRMRMPKLDLQLHSLVQSSPEYCYQQRSSLDSSQHLSSGQAMPAQSICRECLDALQPFSPSCP